MSSPVPGINTVGVVGAGQMGNGIAHVFALSGYTVLISDLEQDRVDAAFGMVEKNLDRQMRKGLITDDEMAGAMARISGVVGLDAFSACDLVVEAAAENEVIKKAIFTPDLKHIVDFDHTACLGNGQA